MAQLQQGQPETCFKPIFVSHNRPHLHSLVDCRALQGHKLITEHSNPHLIDCWSVFWFLKSCEKRADVNLQFLQFDLG